MFEAGQAVHSISYSLNTPKLEFDSCLNKLTRPIVAKEKMDLSFGRVPHVKCGVIHTIFNFLYGESDDLDTLNKIKQNIHLSQENQLT